MTHLNIEEIFEERIEMVKPNLNYFSDYDLVVGIPFSSDDQKLPEFLQSMDKILQSWLGRRQLIVCIGDSSAKDVLESIQELTLQHPHIDLLMPKEISGRGMSIRGIIEITNILEADLLLFSANMATETGPGINDFWLESLLTPIQGQYDLVVGSMRRYLGIDSIAHMMAAPFLETFYGSRIGDPLGGIYAVSHDFVEELAHETKFWGDTIRGFGIDFWLLTRALCWDKNICEVNMGGLVKTHRIETRNRIFRDTAYTIFEAIKRDSAIWLQDRLVIKVADILVRSEVKKPDILSYSLSELLNNFSDGYSKYASILNELDKENELQKIDPTDTDNFSISDGLWVSALFTLLLEYVFNPEKDKADIFAALTSLYNGRVASYIIEMQSFVNKFEEFPQEEKDELMVRKMESIRQRLTNRFWLIKPALSRHWIKKVEQAEPAIIPLGYLEYVPGKPIVVPKLIVGKDKRKIKTDSIFKELRKRYQEKFNEYTEKGLGLSPDTEPGEIVEKVREYIDNLEKTVDRLFPGDIHTYQGLKEFIDSIFVAFPKHSMFTVSADLLREIMVRFPPVNIMISFNCYKPANLVKNFDIRDTVTYANLAEGQAYNDQALVWLLDNLKPEYMEWEEIKPVILEEDMQMKILSQGKFSNFNRITARISIEPLEFGKGGKYPKLRYLSSILRHLAAAESYSELFTINVMERKNIGLKLRNSILSLKKGDDFSAYNIFENYHHRKLVERVMGFAQNLNERGETEAAHMFSLMSDGYGLSQVLEDETFLTCSAWSWASYSFKGGLKTPTPLTTSVENRWFNHDLLEDLYEKLGYQNEDIMQTVFRFIQSGKSEHNLLDTLLPARPKDVTVVVQETTSEPSKSLHRYEGNPIITPDEKNKWESKYVLNPGALRIKDKIYLFYRAVGDDNISRVGLAISDGYNILERLPEPIFSPIGPEEKMGCEDARLIIVEDRIFMLYTAYDGNIAQIASASIPVEEFVGGNYTNWHRDGLAFTNIWDKDAILFPEKINDKYVIYHRIEPSIWVTYFDQIKFPLREKHAIILGPRPGRMWDSLKIGAGAQPIKTKYGWLLIYHGVDYNYVYRLGVLLVDLHNPQKVIYRSPNPILEPEEDYEIGLNGAWVPNVVFTCGAVPDKDKEVLEDDDLIMVYYGAADTSIGVATASLADLIPQRFRC